MAWRDNLVAASFRGAGFSVNGTDAPIAGRRVAVHEYPGRDEPFVEDLGRRTKRWEIEAFVVGDDYAIARDRLIEECDMPGAGELVHPYLGSLQVGVHGVQPDGADARGAHGAIYPGVRRGRCEPVSYQPRKHWRQRAQRRGQRGRELDRPVPRNIRSVMARRDYRQGLRHFFRWMPWPLLVACTVLLFPLSPILGCLVGAWTGTKKATTDHCSIDRMIWTRGRR